MVHLSKGFAGALAVFTVLIIVTLVACPQGSNAQESTPTKPEKAGSHAGSSTAESTFTITKIDAGVVTGLTFPQRLQRGPAKDTIYIHFTDRCGISSLRNNLKFIPSVPLQWHNSSISERNILTLRGSFKPGQHYVLVLPPGFESANGKPYAKGITSFAMPNLQPEITFYDQGTVIERNSRQMLHVQLINVDEILVKGIRIPAALVPLALRQVKAANQPTLNETKDAPKINDHEIGTALSQSAERLKKALGNDGEFRDLVGDVVEEEQLFFNRQERNLYHQFSIPMTFRQEKEKGAIELVRVMSKQTGQSTQTSFRLLRITDIGLTYKLSDNVLLVWATSLYSGKPLRDVTVYGFTNNHEVVLLGRSDAKGFVSVHNNVEKKRTSLKSGSEGRVTAKPLMLNEIKEIAAVMSNDQTYVEIIPRGNVTHEDLQRSTIPAIQPARFKKPANTQQQKQESKASPILKGHIFTERGIYRPGETVYFKGTIRQYQNGVISPPAAGSPVFRIVNSKGEEVYHKTISLSDFGTAGDNFGIKTYFPLGTYTLHMKYGQNESETVNSTFEVQEFRQPRHYVEIRYKRETLKDDSYINLARKKELLNCEITGKYYAGGPVKHGRVRWSIYHTKTDYPRQDYKGFTFGYPLDARADLIESGESMLDEKGNISVPVPIDNDILSGKYGIEMAASVVDFDGRASSGSSVYQADPDYLVGISDHQPLVKPGENQTLYAMVIDKKGRKVSKGTITVQVMERDYTYIQKRNAEGNLYYESQQIWRSQLSAKLPIRDDKAVFDFDFTRGGEYLIAFIYTDAKGREYTSATKYSMSGYYRDYENSRRQQGLNYGKLRLYPEKSLYTPGESIKLYLNLPHKTSACLVTVEQEGLLEYRIIELKPGQRFIELPIKASYTPNVYISVVATVPRSSFPVYTAQFDTDAPTFLFGTVNVEVKGNQQKIKISVNEEQKKLRSLPGAEMTLTLSTTDQDGKGLMSEVAVAVVDESILSMTGFETPSLDILGKFLLPLGVFTGDLRMDLLKQTPYGFFRNAPLTGGDGEEKGAEAVSSKIRKDFNPVAYFNPAIRTDENGRATVKFTFPDTMTTYRIYAVACDKGSHFGSFQRPALVVKDFYLEPGLPAFLTRGDRFRFEVSAFNKTERSGSVEFSAKPDQLLALTTMDKSFTLPGFDRVLIPANGTAQKAGFAEIQFDGKFNELSDIVQIKLPVNSGHVLGSGLRFGSFRKEAQVKYDLPKAVKELRWEDVGPEEVKAVVTVSGSPFLRMSQGLRYFLHYPYGCVEQTSSGVLPIAAIRDILQKGLIPDITTVETDKYIKPGIERLFSMQTSDGGFGYWPGDRVTNKWGTIYAMNALTRASLAGYEIPQDRMGKGTAYLQEQIKASGKDEFTFRAFSAYILALNKSLNRETFNKVSENSNNQPREATMLMLMAAKIAKFMSDEQVKTRLRNVLEQPWNRGKISDEFYALYREPAISLLAATLVFPKEEITDVLAVRLMGGMNQEGIWTSTSDSGWSLTALSEYFSGSKTGTQPATVTVSHGGKMVDTFTLDPKSYHTLSFDPREFLKNPTFSISSDRDQTILYKLALTFPRTDYAKSGYNNGFDIHKTIKNTDGTNTLKIGDIAEVKLKLNIKNPGSNYVVVDDPLPAGFVAINSAIKTEEQGVVAKRMKKNMPASTDEEEDDDAAGEFGDGFGWSDWYWDPMGYYRFTPNFMEIRNDRVLAFRNRAWNGIYEYSYYVRAVCEGEFVMPSSKIQLMYDPDVVAYTPQGKVIIKRK